MPRKLVNVLSVILQFDLIAGDKSEGLAAATDKVAEIGRFIRDAGGIADRPEIRFRRRRLNVQPTLPFAGPDPHAQPMPAPNESKRSERPGEIYTGGLEIPDEFKREPQEAKR